MIPRVPRPEHQTVHDSPGQNTSLCMTLRRVLYSKVYNNNNNNNRVYTPLSERCSQSRVFTTYQIQITEKKYMLT